MLTKELTVGKAASLDVTHKDCRETLLVVEAQKVGRLYTLQTQRLLGGLFRFFLLFELRLCRRKPFQLFVEGGFRFIAIQGASRINEFLLLSLRFCIHSVKLA